MTPPRSPVKFLLYGALSLSGILAWAGHFGLAYGVQHLVCQSALIPANLWHVTLAAATGLFIACIGLVKPMPRHDFGTGPCFIAINFDD